MTSVNKPKLNETGFKIHFDVEMLCWCVTGETSQFTYVFVDTEEDAKKYKRYLTK